MRLTGGCVDVAVQVDRLDELTLGALEVTGQQSRLPDQRGGERDPPQRPGPGRASAQLLGLGDHLGVRHGSVEQVLRHAEVGVEDRGGQPLLALAATQLVPEPVEPLAAVVRDQALQRHEVGDRTTGRR